MTIAVAAATCYLAGETRARGCGAERGIRDILGNMRWDVGDGWYVVGQTMLVRG